ncbi:hypothetical protein CFIMG_007854RA00001 [Ceratocystis fimbriata CBS 114723]|uniref:Uncharacterized protein n=1 Tax=Ceratocystis fimbriata CBS 114723 TaxID=1035309 RepID=A0A2C5WRD2_9PEZI|nr:hypothetical protein CFIMG_007854RA00001 [Ceratocystis fimbriata CBS 114723]
MLSETKLGERSKSHASGGGGGPGGDPDDGGDGGDSGDGQPDAFHIKDEDEMEGTFIPDLRRMGGHPEGYFHQAVAAAARWKFRPFTIGDKIYPREITVRMLFPALSSHN